MRLNHNVRVEIIRNAMKPFRERQHELDKRGAELARSLYDLAFPEHIRKHVVALHDTGRGWFPAKQRLTFNVNGNHIRLALNTNEWLPVPHAAAYDNSMCGNAITDTAVVGFVMDHVHAMEAFEKERKQTEATLTTLLKSVGSTDALFKVWPEGRKFYSVPPLTEATKTGVPAVTLQQMNASLGLI